MRRRDFIKVVAGSAIIALWGAGRAGNKKMSVMRAMPADGTFAARPER
jgi:hypothetical protein